MISSNDAVITQNVLHGAQVHLEPNVPVGQIVTDPETGTALLMLLHYVKDLEQRLHTKAWPTRQHPLYPNDGRE